MVRSVFRNFLVTAMYEGVLVELCEYSAVFYLSLWLKNYEISTFSMKLNWHDISDESSK